MIIIFLNWIYIFFTTFIIGIGTVKSLGYIYKIKFTETHIHPTFVSLLGLAVITATGNYFSIFYSVNWEFSAILLAVSLLTGFLLKHDINVYFNKINYPKIHHLTLVAMVAIVFIAIIKASGVSEVMDEGEYYLPLIRWIENYPVISGTGLFNDRMAYNSSFHLSSAIYSHVFIFKGGLYDLNSYLFVIINLYFLGAFNRMVCSISSITFIDIFKVLAIIALYRQLTTSIDTDYPHIFIGLLLILIFLKKAMAENLKKWDIYSLLLLMLSLYLVSVKFLAIYFLPFLAILFYWQIEQKKARHVWVSLVLGALYILPWFIRNIYLSGYLVYPIYKIDLFSVDWKIPVEIAKNNYFYISEHAKIGISRHSLFYDGVREIGVTEWLPLWWKNHVSINISALITAVLLPPAVCMSIYVLVGKGKILWQNNQGLIITLGLSYFFLLFWFFNYPDVRFGWHWILFVLTFSFYAFNLFVIKIPVFGMRYFCVALLCLSLSRSVYSTVKEMPSEFLKTHLIFPEEVNTQKGGSVKKIGNITVTVSEDMFCWGAPAPCMPKYYDELNIIMRGNNIIDGFKLKK